MVEFSRASFDHSFRKTDLSLFPGLSSSGGSAELSFPPARFVAGRSKEAQRFVCCLLTPLGSIRSDPDMGSEFASYMSSRANSGFFYDLDSVFSSESLRVISWISDRLGFERPDDEVIESATLLEWGVFGTFVSISARLEFSDGNPGTVLIPVSLPTPENRRP